MKGLINMEDAGKFRDGNRFELYRFLEHGFCDEMADEAIAAKRPIAQVSAEMRLNSKTNNNRFVRRRTKLG